MGVINFSDPNSANPSPSVYQNHFSTSPAQHQQQLRQATSFVDPSLLNANNFPSPGAEQQFQNGFQQLHRPTASPTPALGHPQSHMQIPAPTSQAQHVSVVVPDINGVPQSVPPEKIATKPLKKKDPNAPKRPRGRPRKDGLPPKAKAPGAASPSGTESDDLEIEEPPESRPTILDDPVPQDREQKATYDTVQAVWSPRNKGAIIERVRNGIALYGELVKRLRDDWKTQNEALKKAELSNAPTDELKRQVAHGRKILQTVMETTLDKGHPAHITKLGENHWTIIALREFLVDRIVATDWDGSLVRSILKVMAQFTTLEQEMLEKTKMEKALSRFAKKSDQEIKILVQRILENAAAASKRKAEKAPSPEPRTVSDTAARTPQLNSSGAKDSLQLAGTKRSRDEAAIQPAAKKPAPQRSIPEASKPLALQNAALKKSESSGKMAKPDATVNGSTAAAKAKPTHPTTTKPAPSVFSTLMSASKKPGTSNAARAAAAAAAAKEKEVKSVSSPTPAGPNTDSPPPTTAPTSTPPVRAAAPSFSFSQTLAGLNKPKEVEEKSVEAMPEETPEEKAKRLRKEARRKLRVTWKSDDTLTEVRLFSHHPDEEVGHADSMIRDVDDVGGEGRMLKMHKDLDELDEDEEAKAVGEDLYPYSPPSVIEFDGIDEEMLKSNFIKRGGMQEPDSPEKAAQEQREQISLMVIYALPSDVPPSPKEPPAVSAGEDYEPPVPIGEPLQPQIRERETKYYANIRAHNTPNQQRNLSDILGAFQPNPLSDLERTFNQYSQGQQSQPHQTPVGAPGEWDFSKLLGLVHQTQQQVESQPIVPQAPAPNNDVSAILANFQPQPSFNLVDLLAQAGTQNGNLNPYGTNQEDPSLSRKHGLDDYDPYEERKKKSRPEALGVNGQNLLLSFLPSSLPLYLPREEKRSKEEEEEEEKEAEKKLLNPPQEKANKKNNNHNFIKVNLVIPPTPCPNQTHYTN
ncbi:putative c-x8-c-x5-c-x3-h type zinc finger protein [Phaeomoniella chlamydospora]|uniref:Putative c-x8-c-x5-c-x3-h type zinc finger protein n=1 Tax=Phaeomoniella chlamydospora TaxID=158046 RepID=A0A0G2EH70_PHACM|nr:putative c-x8-c-x5-c-x3-h type zinc finger protein [Phaeomoniella chlamydospora]